MNTMPRALPLALLLCSLATSDVAAATSIAGAKATLLASEVSWGTMLQGDIFEHQAKIRNDGDQPLIIDRVKPSCGCTTVDFDREIAPGAVGSVRIRIDSSSILGNGMLKWIDIITNDKKRSHKFFIKGDVKPLLGVDTGSLHLSAFPGQPLSLTAIVTPACGMDVEIQSIVPRKNLVTVTLETLSPGKKYRLKLDAPPSKVSKVLVDRLDLKVRTADGRNRHTVFDVMIEHKRQWDVTPPIVVFASEEMAKLAKGSVTKVVKDVDIKATDPNFDFEMDGVEVQTAPPSGFHHELTTVVPGKHYRLRLEVSEVYKVPFARAALKIKTKAEGMNVKILTVQIRAPRG